MPWPTASLAKESTLQVVSQGRQPVNPSSSLTTPTEQRQPKAAPPTPQAPAYPFALEEEASRLSPRQSLLGPLTISVCGVVCECRPRHPSYPTANPLYKGEKEPPLPLSLGDSMGVGGQSNLVQSLSLIPLRAFPLLSPVCF